MVGSAITSTLARVTSAVPPSDPHRIFSTTMLAQRAPKSSNTTKTAPKTEASSGFLHNLFNTYRQILNGKADTKSKAVILPPENTTQKNAVVDSYREAPKCHYEMIGGSMRCL